MLAAAEALQTDLLVYYQYWNPKGSGWVRYKYGAESDGNGSSFLIHCIQGGSHGRRNFHCEPIADYPIPE